MTRFLYLLISCLVFFSCNDVAVKADACSEKVNLDLNYKLIDTVKIAGKTYCEVVSAALDGNREDILNLTLYNPWEGMYQHGAVLIAVIDKIGEKRYTEIISSLSFKEKNLLYNKLTAGASVTANKKYYRLLVDIAFPFLTEEIKKRDNIIENK